MRFYQVVPHLFGHFEPGLLQTEDGAAIEGWGDFQHGIVVMETAADIGHRHPLLHHCYPYIHILTLQDLCSDQVTDL